MADKEPTKANGYPFGRPDDRDSHPLDEVIRDAIEALPMEVRLYPDIYAWRVTDAVLEAFNESGVGS